MSTKANSLRQPDIATALATMNAEIVLIRQELATIRELLQHEPHLAPIPKNDPGRFFGMWSDFTPEEEAIFKQIAEERSHYFSAEPPDLDSENAT